MIYNGIIEGKYIKLRSVKEDDAEFTLQIRQNPEKTKYLHAVPNDMDIQRKWIKKQITQPGDYFFIAESYGGNPVGTVGICDIEGDSGYMGRLLMIGNPFMTFEAAMLAAEFAYDVLGLEFLKGIVISENKASMNISEAIGFVFGESYFDEELGAEVSVGVGTKKDFGLYKEKIQSLIYR